MTGWVLAAGWLVVVAPEAPTTPDASGAPPGPRADETRRPPSPAAVAGDPGAPVPVPAKARPPDGPRYMRAADAPGVPKERPGPPFYDGRDEQVLRARFGLSTDPAPPPRKVRWRCLVADPLCGITVEVQALSAYALRARQGSVATINAQTWHSARAQYDLWLMFPAVVRTRGRTRYNLLAMGPKGGVVGSDGGHLWGDLGLAMRAFFGTGPFAPHLEVTGGLTFRVAGRDEEAIGSVAVVPVRSPVGFSMDVGFGLGGFGSIVVGGQYDSPLAREEVPESLRTPAAGMFYVGFRGNILWGAPLAAAVTAHALAGRYAGPTP